MSEAKHRNDSERGQVEAYLKASGWKKDACGWWESPFGYGLDEAIAMHKESAEKTARAFNEGDAYLLQSWLKHERREMLGDRKAKGL
jgi:hypothetical protein